MATLVNASDPLVYGAWGEKTFENYFQRIGSNYKRQTTFASDFCIAEWYDIDDITDTFNRAFEFWKVILNTLLSWPWFLIYGLGSGTTKMVRQVRLVLCIASIITRYTIMLAKTFLERTQSISSIQ